MLTAPFKKVIVGGAGFAPQTPTNILITSFICGFIFQFYVYRRHHNWWAKYNYVLSAALDSGTFICSLFIFICINGINSVSKQKSTSATIPSQFH